MHLGVIPDGNRRYAERHGTTERDAYRGAKDVIMEIFDNIDDLPLNIDEATLYFLSEDNLKRSDEELETLFDLLKKQMDEAADTFSDNGFRFNWVSTKPEALPEDLQNKLEKLEQEHNEGSRRINALISYSGKKDVVQAAENVCGNGNSFNKDSIKKELALSSQIDYVIRTGDNPTRESISDFPIWNASYAEYYHVKKHFPAVELEDVKEALRHFKKLRRKKGE